MSKTLFWISFISGSTVTGVTLGLLYYGSSNPYTNLYRTLMTYSLATITASETLQYATGESKFLEKLSTWAGIVFVPLWGIHWNLKKFLSIIQYHVLDIVACFKSFLNAIWDGFVWVLKRICDCFEFIFDIGKYLYDNFWLFRVFCNGAARVINKLLDFVFEVIIRIWRIIRPILSIVCQVLLVLLSVGALCATPIWIILASIGCKIYEASSRIASAINW